MCKRDVKNAFFPECVCISWYRKIFSVFNIIKRVGALASLSIVSRYLTAYAKSGCDHAL